jgi:hypothetical protein
VPDSEKIDRYSETLKHYQNQSDDDYDSMLVDNKIRGIKFTDSSGNVVPVTTLTISKVLARRIFIWIAWALLFSVPLIVTYIWVKPIGSSVLSNAPNNMSQYSDNK